HTAELDLPDAGDGREPGDRRHAPLVVVAEGLTGRLPPQTTTDLVSGVLGALHRGLRDTGNTVDGHQVTDHEHLGASGKRAARLDQHASGPVRRRPRLLSELPAQW